MQFNTQQLAKKKNIQLYLSGKKNLSRRKIIQISYDIRSGHSIKKFPNREIFFKKYISEVKNLIEENFPKFTSVLDCGAGELITTNLLFRNLRQAKKIFCFDFSLKRLVDGKKFVNKLKIKKNKKINIFCADMFNIPLPENSIDLITTFQSLEPNGNYEEELIKELFRVSKKGLFLMEPDYENANIKQKRRMKKFNYIRNLPKVFNKLKLNYKIIKMNNHGNPYNKCSAFIVFKKTKKNNKPIFVDPINKKTLKEKKNLFYEKFDGNLYFKFNSIPILMKEKSILLPNLKQF